MSDDCMPHDGMLRDGMLHEGRITMTPRILLVEDDPVSRTFLQAAAEALPAHVDTATTCAEAIHRAGRQTYDLWLIDANLPDGLGSGLLATLRSLSATTPALAQT